MDRTHYPHRHADRRRGYGHEHSMKRAWDHDYVVRPERYEDRGVPMDETDRLIASDKVEGTRVYDRRGNRLGHIENFMVEKRSGRVEYAILSFGGFLGLGERHYPLPWQVLDYDERLGGYVVDITERDLERAPSHRAGEAPRWDMAYSQGVYGFWGVPFPGLMYPYTVYPPV